MSFAENKFLVITAVVAVILAGGLVYYGMTISSAIEDEQMAERMKLVNDMDRYARGTPANLETIEAKRLRVDKMKEQRQKVVEMDVAFNRREQAYVIPQLENGGQTWAALPFVDKIWNDNGLYYKFVQAYYRHLENQIVTMNRVELPTEAEIQTEAVKIQKRLDRMELRRTKSGRPAVGAPPGPGMAGAPRASTAAGSQLSEEALTAATNQLRLAKAQKGRIYVDINSFEQMFVRGVMIPSLEPEQIWRAHLAMWVSSDVVDAVNQTIDDVFTRENVPENQRNVLASPIKSLASVTLSDVAPASRRTEMPFEDEFGGPGGRRPTPTGGQALPTASTLSQRNSSPLYNVVRYSFTVIMPTRYIPTLQSKLINLNYHTILNQEIVPLAAQEADLRYFGTEPVRQVTFTGEVLLLSDWVRGTWNEETEAWTYLPLMPIPVMQNWLADAQRRNTDKQLIEGRLPRPWDPTYTPPEEPVRRAGRRIGR